MCSSAAPSHEPGSRSPLTASSPMFSAVSATERSLRKYTTFFFSFPVSAAVHCSSFEPSSTKTRRLSGSERKSSSGRPPSSEASSFLNFSGLHLRPRHTAASSQPVAGAEGAPSAIAQLPGGFCWLRNVCGSREVEPASGKAHKFLPPLANQMEKHQRVHTVTFS